jgi:hypothetical protein
LLCIALSRQDCADKYGGYLQSIKGVLDKDYGGHETEFGTDYRKLVLSCFVSDVW